MGVQQKRYSFSKEITYLVKDGKNYDYAKEQVLEFVEEIKEAFKGTKFEKVLEKIK
jgi:hypothetical protein